MPPRRKIIEKKSQIIDKKNMMLCNLFSCDRKFHEKLRNTFENIIFEAVSTFIKKEKVEENGCK